MRCILSFKTPLLHLKFGLIGLAAFIGGCSTPPAAYQPNFSNGGYSVQKLPGGIFEASFEGPATTDTSRYYDFATLHAAEVTAEAGMKYLIILDQDSRRVEKRIRSDAMPAQHQKFGEIMPSGKIVQRTAVIPGSRGAGMEVKATQICFVRFKMVHVRDTQIPAHRILESQPTIVRLKTKYRL